MKLNRQFKVLVQTSESSSDVIEINSPLTLQFNVQRSTSSSINTGSFQIYNLSSTNRGLIFRDRLSAISSSTDAYRKIIIQAGYNELSTIFSGNILEAYSARQRSDVITYISAQDGADGMQNSFSNKTIESGLTLRDVAESLVSDLRNVTKGKIGTYDTVLPRGAALNGNTFTLLKNYFGQEVFIDLENVNVLNATEAFTNIQIPKITSETGLLSTPRLQGNIVTVELLFEPRIRVGQVVEIVSSVDPLFNGQYKVVGITHTGVISGAVGGECKTILELFVGDRSTQFDNKISIVE